MKGCTAAGLALACNLCIPLSVANSPNHQRTTWHRWRRNGAPSQTTCCLDRTTSGQRRRHSTAFAVPCRTRSIRSIATDAAAPRCRSAVSLLPSTIRDDAEDVDTASPSLFIFGVGYVATAVAMAFQRNGWTVHGTCTDPRKVKSLREQGIKVGTLTVGSILSALHSSVTCRLAVQLYKYRTCKTFICQATGDNTPPPRTMGQSSLLQFSRQAKESKYRALRSANDLGRSFDIHIIRPVRPPRC